MLDTVTRGSQTDSRGDAGTRTRKRWPLAAGVTAVAAAAAIGTFWVRAGAGGAPQVADGAELIAVMPLGAPSDSSLARLGRISRSRSARISMGWRVAQHRCGDAADACPHASIPHAPADRRRSLQGAGARSVMTGTLIREGTAYAPMSCCVWSVPTRCSPRHS